jgi:hypothetical protein
MPKHPSVPSDCLACNSTGVHVLLLQQPIPFSFKPPKGTLLVDVHSDITVGAQAPGRLQVLTAPMLQLHLLGESRTSGIMLA